MRLWWSVVVVTSLAFGCDSAREAPGGPGATSSSLASSTSTSSSAATGGGGGSGLGGAGGVGGEASASTAGGQMVAGVGGSGGAQVGVSIGWQATDFSVLDVNPNSATFDQPVSPKDYLMKVSGWYFGHAT